MFNCLVNVTRTESGVIKLKNISTQNMDAQILRQDILVVSRENLFFNKTLYENIDIKGSHSISEVENVIKIFDVVTSRSEFKLFNDINFPVSYEGNNLSGGQKSFIIILRSLLISPRILCMDESNSEFDNEIGILLK